VRTREFRRYKQEVKVISRINRIKKRNYSYYRYFRDANNFKHSNPSLTEFIGTSTSFMYKTYTTDRYDSRYKEKYSPNRTYSGWNRSGGDMNTREFYKKESSKQLKEYYDNRFDS
jgi:hypothetical protein